MTERGTYYKAAVLIWLARRLMALPDRTIAGLVGLIGIVLRVVGFDAVGIQTVSEVRQVFLSGPRSTAVVRRMLREGDPHRLRMIVRGSLLNRGER